MQAILTMDGNTGGDFEKQDRPDHSNNLVGGLMAVLVVTVIITSLAWMMKPATLPIRQVHIEGEFLRLDTNGFKGWVMARLGVVFLIIVLARNGNPWWPFPW